FVYPTWWSGPPAILKGWLERVMTSGVAFHFNQRGKVRPSLTEVRHLVGISTYGAPWHHVKFVHDNGRRLILRALRVCCGQRVRRTWLALDQIDTATDDERARFLHRIETAMAALR